MNKLKIKIPLGNEGTIDEPIESTPQVDTPVDHKDTTETTPSTEDPIEAPKTTDTPKPEETQEAVLVDDKEYKLDKDGNALNEDGSIYMNKEELDKLTAEPNETEPVDVTIDDLEKLSGIEVLDSTGNKVPFDLTLEGLAQREKAIKDLGIKEGNTKALDAFFKENPDIYKALIHKQKTGSLEGFTTQPIYKNLQLDTTNEEQLANLIIEAEVKKGSSLERAKNLVKFFKAENQLETEGKDAHKYLVELEDKEFKSYEDSKTESYKKAVEQEAKFYGTYYDESGKEVVVNTEGSVYNKIVTKGQFGNFVIPQEGIKVKTKEGTVKTLSRRDIFDYMAKPVTSNGLTQAQVDEMNRLKGTDNLLYQWLGNLTGNDFSQLIERKILEEKGKTIKARLRTKTSSPSTPSDTTNKRIKVPIR